MNANNLADEFVVDNADWNEDNLRHWGKEAVTMLRQLEAENQELKTLRGNSVLVPSDKLKQMQAEIHALKDQLAIVSNNLRQGISKSIQKAQAKSIDETLDDWKLTREYCS